MRCWGDFFIYQNTMTTTKILFIGATHGDEPIGVRALCTLCTKVPNLEWIIGNPPAYRANTRAFEGDLNRSAPGDSDAPIYASRRAAEILAKAKAYDWAIDLHGSTAYCGIFIIITKMTRANLRLAARLNIPHIVYWPSISPELSGPLSEFFPCGLEIECGPKDMPLVEEQLTAILEAFVKEKDVEIDDEEAMRRLQAKGLFQVVGSSMTSRNDLEEFVEATIDGEKRFPLLVNQYADQGIACYTMDKRTVSDWWN